MLPKKKPLKFKFQILFLVALFLISFLLLIFSELADSQTTDEAIHLFSGFTYLTQRDFRLDPEHPPFLKELGALPLLFFKNLHYDLDKLWQKAGIFSYDSWQEARIMGEKFFYLWNEPAKVLFWGRLPFILLTLLLGYFGYFWARKLYGTNAGVLAAFLILFCPTILAHGRLINTDLGVTLFIFITVYFWGEFLKEPKRKNLILASLFLGLALASKYTGFIILPILFLLSVIKALFFDREKKILLKYAISLLTVILIALIVVWLTYGFLWPVEYYKGMLLVFRHAFGGHGSFLLGQNSSTGWWYYFPVAIFYKTPIPIFILLLISLIFWKKLRTKLFDEMLLILPPIIYLIFSMFSRADLGVRHILPIFPFIFAFSSKSINLIATFKPKMLHFGSVTAVLILIGWYLISAFGSFPNYLAYFNEFAGGAKGGYRILTDSNLDWGQDIFRMKEFLDDRSIEKVYLVYPWDGDLALKYYGIDFVVLMPDQKDIRGPVVISATYYQTEAYAWLHQYPFSEITPGVFYIDIR